jgi:hypothetical protein
VRAPTRARDGAMSVTTYTTTTVEKKDIYISALARTRDVSVYVSFGLARHGNDQTYQRLSRSEAWPRASSCTESRGRTPQNRRTASPCDACQTRAAGSRPRSLSPDNDLGRVAADQSPREKGLGGGGQLSYLAANRGKPAEMLGF